MYITNLHRRRRGGVMFTYAELVEDDGRVVIGATLDYILDAIHDRGYDVRGVRKPVFHTKEHTS